MMLTNMAEAGVRVQTLHEQAEAAALVGMQLTSNVGRGEFGISQLCQRSESVDYIAKPLLA